MKKIIPFIAMGLALTFSMPSCGEDNNIDLSDYEDWRIQNEQWLEEMKAKKDENGKPYYSIITPRWNPRAYILMRFLNDTNETSENLKPLYTSVVDVIYEGYDCEGEPFDSSKTTTKYGKLGIQRFQCNQTIPGWSIAMENMHVGDTAEVIVPYEFAYGTSITGSIKPYSCLRFNMRLDDIYRYEASPY